LGFPDDKRTDRRGSSVSLELVKTISSECAASSEDGFGFVTKHSVVGVMEACLVSWRRVRFLSDDCEGELVVPLGDDCYCVAVSELEGELVSGKCAATA
jgi:hypothetical protein